MKACERWFARLFHVFLTSMVLLLLFLKDTELRFSLYNGQLYYVECFLSLLSLSTLLFFICSFINPGFVSRNSIDLESGVIFHSKDEKTEILPNELANEDSETTSMLIKDARNIRLRQCRYCNIIQPLRAKHCEECKRCVRRYDHHCPWIGNCVGESNHKFFLMFLCSETALIAWSAYVIVKSFVPNMIWKEWFSKNWMYLVLSLFLFLSLLVTGLLSICHSYMMLTAQTTWEFMSRSRISYLKKFPENYNPFDKGYLWNVISFLCYFRSTNWDDYVNSDL